MKKSEQYLFQVRLEALENRLTSVMRNMPEGARHKYGKRATRILHAWADPISQSITTTETTTPDSVEKALSSFEDAMLRLELDYADEKVHRRLVKHQEGSK